MSDKPEELTPVYSQGIMFDGPVILKDGRPMTPEEIVKELNQKHSKAKQEQQEKDIKAVRVCLFDRPCLADDLVDAIKEGL